MKAIKPSSLFISKTLAVILTVLSSCWSPPDCDFQKEPSLSLFIDNGVVYTDGYALKNDIKLNGSKDYFRLPVSMNDDTMMYTFSSPEGTDTLELVYTKTVQYKKDCGFTLSMDLQSGELTTFGSVNFYSESIHVQ